MRILAGAKTLEELDLVACGIIPPQVNLDKCFFWCKVRALTNLAGRRCGVAGRPVCGEGSSTEKL